MNRLFSFLALMLVFTGVKAQDNTVLTIGDKSFSLEEFNYIYDKNNALTQEPVGKQEYVDLFVNYKLKVEEAIAQGYDTMPSFKNELNYYRNELAKPYLTDEKAVDEVVKEAYEHMLYEVDASHILIKLPQSPSPEDTLKVYKQMQNLQQQLANGVAFESLVAKHSQCPSAQQSNGNLGYFGAFMMVYPFEKAAYDTPVGEVSDITRTSFGYHLIKVNDKRKNKGEILVAHIMKAFPHQAGDEVKKQAKAEIDTIYKKLIAGESFSNMAVQYSDDKQTASNNGKLPWFGTGRMVPAFSSAAFSLTENGQISEPVKTQFGWHIIKRLDVRPVKPLEECRDDIIQKIKRDERAFAGKKATIERLKKDYAFQINEAEFNAFKALAVKASKEEKSVFLQQIKAANIVLAQFANEQITTSNMADNAFTFNLPPAGFSEANILHIWNEYIDGKLLDYEKANLENKYPEFKYLMNEYHDGLLIFEISQKEIWNKASNDSTGLATFYEMHKNDYLLDEHFDGRLFYCEDKATYKQLKKLLKKNDGLIVDSLEATLKNKLLVKKGQFFKGDEAQLDMAVWKEKQKVISFDYPYLLTNGNVIAQSIQPLEQVRGRVISDYQEELEKKWMDKLKNKYNPQVNTLVFEAQ